MNFMMQSPLYLLIIFTICREVISDPSSMPNESRNSNHMSRQVLVLAIMGGGLFGFCILTCIGCTIYKFFCSPKKTSPKPTMRKTTSTSTIKSTQESEFQCNLSELELGKLGKLDLVTNNYHKSILIE